LVWASSQASGDQSFTSGERRDQAFDHFDAPIVKSFATMKQRHNDAGVKQYGLVVRIL